jgi:hypothetical protein
MSPLRLLVVCALVGWHPASGAALAAQNRTSPPLPTSVPGTGASVVAMIQGNALNSDSSPLPDSLVRLRDVRYGRIAGSQATDKAGVFSFGRIDPGAYVVELIGQDLKVVAASEFLSVNGGDVVSAIVKLPFRPPPFGGVFGHTVQQALTVMAAAAASGVLATNVGGVDASPR